MAAFNGVVTGDSLPEPSYGLFSVARVQKRGASDEHWMDGYFVETDACGGHTQVVPQCYATDTDWIEVIDNSDGAPFIHVVSFAILETFECENSIGFNAIDRRATTIDLLDRVSEFAVEHELWAGDNAQTDSSPWPATRWLESAQDATPTPGTAVKPTVALALVEQQFAAANPGIQATIHVTPLIATILDSYGAFEKEGDRITTPTGSLVSISRGGVGDEGPHTGGSATKHWIYATGPVHVDLGSEELITTSASEIVNPVTNKITVTAERPAAVYFDGCAWFGALADATL